MNVAMDYLDKRSATVNALKDYEAMEFILAHTKEEISDTRQEMERMSTPTPSDMPRGQRRPHRMEERIVNCLDVIDVMKNRYQYALEYMSWFQPAWETLSKEERNVLRKFYMSAEERQTDNILDLCEQYHIERTSVYKRKDRALAHLTLLLYGK